MPYVYNRNEIRAAVFDFIYGCALRDAILQKAFECEDKKWVRDVTVAQALVRNYIDCILRGDYASPASKSRHDEFFISTANAVCAVINSARPSSCGCTFTFGNAQKLINMTVKHVYAHTYSCPKTRECFRNCHCPMDSIMLEKVWKAYKDTFDDKSRKAALISSDYFHSAWSNEGITLPLSLLPNRYERFQNAIVEIIAKNGGDILPIEYDYLVWA